MNTTVRTSPLEYELAADEAAIMLEILTDDGEPVFLWGTTGIGKTDLTKQLGLKKGRKVMEFHAALRETVDLRGIPVPDLTTGKTVWLVPNELPQVERDGEFGYLFLDEFNQASPQMQAVLAGLVLYGVVGEYHLPKGWIVIAAGNRVSDRAAAQRMPTHLRNRFAHINVVPDVEAWSRWAAANGVDPKLVAFVRFRRELLHRMPRGDENSFPTPRSLTKAAKFVKVANSARRQKLFASLIGYDVAGELNGFIELYNSITGLDDIIANPTKAKVPTEPSQKYATFTGLARKATRANFPAIMQYADRLDDEGQMILVHDATIANPKLKETAAYSNWAVKNQGLILQS